MVKRGFGAVFLVFFIAFMLFIPITYAQVGDGGQGSISGKATDGFDLNSLVLKASIEKGETVTKILTISKGHGQKVMLEVIGLKGIELSEKAFTLDDGVSKNIQVKFDSANLNPGAYVGSIKVSDEKSSFYLPIIFEIESKDVFYDVNLDISPQYANILPGDKLVAQLKIFDLTSGGTSNGLGRNSVTLEYIVKDTQGKVISTETENTVVEKQAQLTKVVSFPKNIGLGEYVFTVSVKYKSSVGVASYLFTIGDESDSGSSSGIFNGGFDFNFVVTLIIIAVFFLGMIVLFVYFIRERDTMIIELKRFNEEEFERQRNFILAQERLLRNKGVSEHKIITQRNEKLGKLRKKHAERIRKVVELKKEGNEKSMEKQLLEWKKRGYNTMGLEYKMKGLSGGEMKSLLEMWKKQYRGK